MAGWIPQSIQKRLLRYALNKSGLLDVTGIDLDNVDISWGRRTTLVFKNVNLNVEYLTGLAHLPPTLHLESAKLLSLRLTIPADLFNSSVSIEASGVNVIAKLVEEKEAVSQESEVFEPLSHDAQRASHGKANRRIQSPSGASYRNSRLPTTEDLAKSFLAEEPLEERRELEAYAGTKAKSTDESIYSESSEGSDVGTGATPGLPGFLSSWLQGLIDRFELSTRHVRVALKVDPSKESPESMPVDLIARLDRVDLIPVSDQTKKRELQFENFSIELEADKQVLSDFSQLSSRASPVTSRGSKPSPHVGESLNQSLDDLALRQFTSQASLGGASFQAGAASLPSKSSDKAPSSASEPITSSDQLQDSVGESELQASETDLDIRMGEDNISWASRRSQGNGPADDPWSQPTEDNLPDSLILGMNRPLPPSHTSVASSSPTRSRRPTSPYDRSFQSPGSWPRIDESPQRSCIHQSPGSWPTLDQSQQSVFHSFTQSPQAERSSPLDDQPSPSKPASHGQLSPSPEASDTNSTEASQIADLSESRYFSPEDAQSIYMDAVATEKQTQMPGAWESTIASNADVQESQPSREARSPDDNDTSSLQSAATAGLIHEEPHVSSGAATPRAATPSQPEAFHYKSTLERSNLQLLYIDAITVSLPQEGAADASTLETSAPSPQVPPSAASETLSMSRHDIPGAFSMYSQLSRSQRRGESSVLAERQSHTMKQPPSVPTEGARPTIEIHVRAFKVQADVPTLQLLYKTSTALKVSSSANDAPDVHGSKKPSIAASLSIETLDAYLHQQIERRLDEQYANSQDGLLNLNCRRIVVDSAQSQHNVRLGNVEVSVGPYTVLSFDQNPQALTESTAFEQDVRVFIDASKHTNSDRPIVNVGAETRPIRIELNLSAFDEVFSTFGGLSGVLDIGGSVASETTPIGNTAPRQQAQRVRFQDDTEPDKSTEFKANASVGGLTVVLCAEETAVMLQTAAIKAIYREQAASVRFFGSLRISGSYLDDRRDAPIQADVAGLWLHYFFTPQEQDLERLLALITPSKDKYDNDDDILVDTLLKQRRKGACLRLTVDDSKVRIDEWQCVSQLQALGAQVGRLSAVAKYLPEDERPGLLSLVRVKQVELRLPINDRFGKLHAAFAELQCAHVGLPALLALSLSDVTLAQANGPQLVHPLVPLSGSDDLPMIMARMMDDEVEPVVKIKLYNVCVEYSVPILLDLTNMDRSSDAEEIVADLASSVADLSMGKGDGSYSKQVTTAPGRTRLHLLLHHSAIGLAPHQTPAKALVILTDARLSTAVPPEVTMEVKLDLRQTGILLTDDRGASRSEPTTTRRNPSQSTVVKAQVLEWLWKQGYVSVGSIMSAVINAHIEKDEHTRQSSVEVDVRSHFFLLETCADSLQTLTVILGSIAPPTAPSKQPKYLTEPITLDDMISSFTGDAYAKPEKPAETLFDVDEMPEQGGSEMGDDLDELLTDADMDSSLYAPIMGDLDDGPEKRDQDYGDTVESLLEDDPFEMTDSPDDMPFSDSALMRDLKQQALPAKTGEPVNLGNWEIEDLGFDALGLDERVLGAGHRFSAPTSRRNAGKQALPVGKLPFKLRLHDSNVTWHLHDGYDWQQTRDGIATAVEQIEQRADERLARRRQALQEPDEEESTIGDVMFNSVYITIPNNFTETPDIRRGINRQIDEFASVSESVSGMSRPTAYSASGRPIRQTNRRRLKLERSRYHKISFELSGLNVDVNAFPPESGELQSSVEVRMKQFEIFDNMPSSTWRKFLTRQHVEGSQEISRPMVHLELLNRRTIQSREATDLMIHVALQPLRLHVDQDALDFITRFFEFKDHSIEPPSPSDQPFLSRVEIDTVDLKLDYKPKKVDYVGLRSGHTTEFMNFVILDQANIQLRHAIVYGIRGFEPLHKTLNDVWMPDVKRNQLPTILAGLAPVRSLVNIGTGVRDVVAIPIREYKKDGRIVRSVQKGALHFGKTTASELVRFGAKVAMGTQNLLSGAEGLLSPQAQHAPQSPDWTGEDDVEAEEREPRAFSAYADQPLGVLSGLKSARRYLEHDLLTARDALIAVQGEVLESANPGSAAMALARHAPTVMLRPVIGASRALGTTLLGMGNQIDRGGIQRMEDKYKPR